MSMVQVPVMRISISWQTGKVLSEKQIGHKELAKSDYGDRLVRLFTGLSTEQACKKLKAAR